MYLQNVNKNADPVQTSIDLYHQISKFIRNIGGTQRYGDISYVIVPKNKNQKRNDYVAFVSFDNTIVHNEVAKVLQNFHFNDVKISIKVNDKPTSDARRRENKIKFQTELDERSKIQDKSKNKRKRVDSSLEVEPRPKCWKTNFANDEESSDSFTSITVVKEESVEDNQTVNRLHQQIEAYKQINAYLMQEYVMLKQNTQKQELEWEIESALYQVKLKMVKDERDKLLREREEVAQMAKSLNDKLNKQNWVNYTRTNTSFSSFFLDIFKGILKIIENKWFNWMK